MNDKTYTFEELSTISDVGLRTVRYYIQIGLLDKPIGQTRGAHYTSLHLEKLLRIKQLSEAGISLERIREILNGEKNGIPQNQKQSGQIEVRSHLIVTEGIEIQVSPETAGMSPEELRVFFKRVLETYREIVSVDKKEGNDEINKLEKS